MYAAVNSYFRPVQEEHEGRGCTNSPFRCQVSPHAHTDIDLCKSSPIPSVLQSFFFSDTLEYGFNHPARRACLAGEEGYCRFMAFQEVVEGSRICDDVHWCSQRVGGVRSRLRGSINLSLGSYRLENGRREFGVRACIRRR